MIEKIQITKDPLFGDVEIGLSDGLSVITGVSGAGKSVMMSNLLSVFAMSETMANVVECDVDYEFFMDEYGIENLTPNSFKVVKDRSTRYFINSQNISKKNLLELSKEHIIHLQTRDKEEFKSRDIISLFDLFISKKQSSHDSNLSSLKENFFKLNEVKRELLKIEEEENKIVELKDLAKFEIEKIEQIAPKIGEFEELMEIKKRLSQKDKIESAWMSAEQIFGFEGAVVEALNISGIDSSFFEEAMNELRIKKESLNLEELNDIEIEKVLDRIDALYYLIRRYKGIKEALEILQKRKEELKRYENLSFEKEHLEVEKKKLEQICLELSELISKSREKWLDSFLKIINSYTKELYMKELDISLQRCDISESGKESLALFLDKTPASQLSSGESNRLSLALIATSAEITRKGGSVIFIDEIDSNLSGKEAMSIANVLLKISKFHQIFAISHQPQLSSKANNHYLITKEKDHSTIRLLRADEKVKELARMVSGEVITDEALSFAKKLIDENS